MNTYTQNWNNDRQNHVSSRKVGKPLGPDAPHYPNKAERVLLTQMMQKSGQTEDQIRSVKSNRIKLALASKSMSARTYESMSKRHLYRCKIARRLKAKMQGVEVWELK